MREKSCFVIAPIGQPESEIRQRSDWLLKYIIVPAAHECGYEDPVRADKLSEPGIITNQVIKHVFEDTLVIADLSEHNPNVFYELALRHTIRKPFVQLIRKADQIPFDVGPMRIIKFDIHNPDSIEAREELKRQIQHLDQNPDEIESPVSQALDIEVLRGNKKPIDRSLGEIVTTIAGMYRVLLDVQKRVSPDIISAARVRPFVSWNQAIADVREVVRT